METEISAGDLLNVAEDMPSCLQRLIKESKWDKITKTKKGYGLYILHSSKGKKPVYLMSGVVHRDIEKVLKAIFDDVELLPQWNPRAISSKIMEVLNPSTDIVHQVVKGVPGLISDRDFLLLRRLETTNINQKLSKSSCVLAMKSIDLSQYPNSEEIVRGESGLCGWLLSEEEEGATAFHSVVDVDLKLKFKVPHKLIEGRFCSEMTQGIDALQKFIDEKQ